MLRIPSIRFRTTSRWNWWFFSIAIVFFTWLKGRLSVENPGGTQQCMEALLTNSMGVGARDLLEDIAGHGGDEISAR